MGEKLEKLRKIVGLKEDAGYLNLDTHPGYQKKALAELYAFDGPLTLPTEKNK